MKIRIAPLLMPAMAAILAAVSGLRALAAPSLPERLSETGLYVAGTLTVDPRNRPFSPQYPLWTDGARKQRWIQLPAGSRITARDADTWEFPVGTRLWKEFAFDGRRVETRMLWRVSADAWAYASYAWNDAQTDATLVPAEGLADVAEVAPGKRHSVPSRDDCRACHDNGASGVLGFSALQLSTDRDPNALHAEQASGVDLSDLIERGLLVGLPASFAPPRITAASATARAALGYLHGNCGHCHNERGPLSNVGLFLRQTPDAFSRAVATTFAHRMKKPAPGQSPDAVLRIEAGHPERSALLQRIASRYPALQMPPLGTALVDEAAVELLRRWILEADATRDITPTEKGPRQ